MFGEFILIMDWFDLNKIDWGAIDSYWLFRKILNNKILKIKLFDRKLLHKFNAPRLGILD